MLNSYENITEKDIENYLELLADYYSPEHFYNCLSFIFLMVHERGVKLVSSKGLSVQVDGSYPYTLDLIFNMFLHCEKFNSSTGFKELWGLIKAYYSIYVVCCCLSEEGRCFQLVSPELPVKVALHLFGDGFKRDVHRKLFLEKAEQSILPDNYILQPLNFDLLVGELVDVDLVIRKVSLACQEMDHIKQWQELTIPLQVLHTAAVRSLLESTSGLDRLLQCYDCFQGKLQVSASVLKRYIFAKSKEIAGDFSMAAQIYRALINSHERVPVFDQLIRCLECDASLCCEKRRDLLMAVCQEAAEYYKDAGMYAKQENYEHKAAAIALESISREQQFFESGTNIEQSGELECGDDSIAVEIIKKPISGKSKGGKRKKTRKATKNVEKESTVLPLPGGAFGRKTSEAQQVVGAEYAGSVSGQNSGPLESRQKDCWTYWKELNELFDDYHHLPHLTKEAVEKLSDELYKAFPDDIWGLHCAAWGFHLTGHDEKATDILLKGLNRSLSSYPGIEIQVKSRVEVSVTLQEIRKHREIMPNTQIGLNIAAYLSSLGHTLYAMGQTEDSEFCRSEADRLNPKRQFKYALRQPL